MADRSPFLGSPARLGLKGAATRVQEKKVRVVARVRPFLACELEQAPGTAEACISISKQQGPLEDVLKLKDPRVTCLDAVNEYRVDAAYGSSVDAKTIFANEVVPFLEPLFEGFNATVFAYGATGSGKTFTMQGTAEQPGVMPLAVRELLEMAEIKGAEGAPCQLAVSYLEVYMERCYDLLEPKAELQVLEDASGDVQLPGLAQVAIKTAEDFEGAFSLGCKRRKTGATGLNEVSSRSHGVLIVSVTRPEQRGGQTVGKLHLIDLAGNEDNRRSGNEGDRMAESSRINTSLFVLSKVITALNTGERRIPYRDSKLTRLLQDSLGGSSRALLVACLAPGATSYKEAVHTLALASKSRQVINRPVVHVKDSEEDDRLARLWAWQESQGRTPRKSLGVTLTPRSSAKRPTVAVHTPVQGPRSWDRSSEPHLDSTPKGPATTSCSARLQELERRLLDSCTLTPSKTPARDVTDLTLKTNRISSSACKDGALRVPFNSQSGSLEDKENKALCAGSNCQTDSRPACTLFGSRKEVFSPSCKQGSGEGTPLSAFTQASRSLKHELEKEYLQLLNTGSKEDLMALKGIGERRAQAILEHREELIGAGTAFRSMQDLVSIGLSEKQVLAVFKSNLVTQMSC